MYDDYFKNYSSQATYQNGYDEYLDYEDDFYSMNNDYDRFIPRQVNNTPYNYNRNYINVSSMYPEIYKQISPIIEKKLNSSTLRSIDNSSLEKLTFEIYDEIAKTDIGKKLNAEVNTINTGYATSGSIQNTRVGTGSSTISNRAGLNQNSNSNKVTNQSMSKYAPTSNSLQNTERNNIKEVSNKPVRSNCLLCDLIKIMILNNLSSGTMPPKHGSRSPYMQSPRPQRPGMPSNRPSYPGTNMPYSGASLRPSYFDVPYPEDFGY